MSADAKPSQTLSQRELRNESGRVLREVAEGRSFVLTNAGVPVARIVPLDAPAARLAIVRPAKRVGGWAALAPQPAEGDRAMVEILNEMRGDRL